MIQKVTIIGAGNLATQLALVLHENGIRILQVYSRTFESATTLAKQVKAQSITDLQDLDRDTDLFIFAVSDKAIQTVLDQMPVGCIPMVHTAGSVPMNIFDNYADEYGAFYPLQTFSKDRKVDFKSIPICIESNNHFLEEELIELANRISKNVHLISSVQRKQLHLAAVFTCNFTNYMYSVGEKLLEDKEMDFSLLQPLIQETAAKIQEMSPVKAQTGPAVRFDEEVMNAHEHLLKGQADFQKLYRFVSECIFKMHR
jgi:predicted short-subunit dehydrogenase-like oxidoreductase (DUF2520 family)